MDDMCYDRRRAEACVDESAHHALANAGGREIVGKKEGEQKGSARGSVHWGCYYATALDIEVDPQRCGLGSCQSDFALQAVVECRALETERVRLVALRWHSSGSEMRLGLPVGLQKKNTQKLAVHAGGSGDYGGEKRSVMIVSELLPVAVHFALRSKTQTGIEVLGMR